MLPVDVLEQCQADLLNWQGSGMSVMEMSHRGKEFVGIAAEAEADLRTLLDIPSNYKVLFMQGGASTQFAAVPLNLATPEDTIDHIVTGSWSKKAIAECEKFCVAHLSAKGDNASIPAPESWDLTEGSKYVHYCDNETIQGVEFKSAPAVGDRLLVGDFSSNFLSKPIDVSKYAVIYSGAQKNVGPAGVTMVIVREDLIGSAQKVCPTMLDYKVTADADSMYNTPPCWSMYVCGLVFKKLLADGGLAAVQERNESKAKLIYDAIAESGGFYSSPVDPAVRSCMNVPFTIPSNPELEAEFIKEAGAAGLKTLKGHRSVGGMRASIYNAMPREGCEALVAFMKEFQAKHS